MTPAEAAIREALEAGPTLGPWQSTGSSVRRGRLNICSSVNAAESLSLRNAAIRAEANAAYIAACNPGAVRALLSELDALRDVLRRNGFVPCDIAACNCGSWHARYGLPQRMEEIQQALADAGHPRSNENGNLTINALAQLVVERDALRARCEADKAMLVEARDGLAGGLWDYGPGQDEHDACEALIEKIGAYLNSR